MCHNLCERVTAPSEKNGRVRTEKINGVSSTKTKLLDPIQAAYFRPKWLEPWQS